MYFNESDVILATTATTIAATTITATDTTTAEDVTTTAATTTLASFLPSSSLNTSKPFSPTFNYEQFLNGGAENYFSYDNNREISYVNNNNISGVSNNSITLCNIHYTDNKSYNYNCFDEDSSSHKNATNVTTHSATNAQHVIEYLDYTQIDAIRYLFIVIYVIIISIAIIGNLLIIWVILRNGHMRTITNCYIVNLAASDVLVATFVMPLKLVEYTTSGWGGDGGGLVSDRLCSFTYMAQPVFVFSSVITLMCISMERYYVIVHPLNAKVMSTKGKTIKLIAVSWLLATLLSLPYICAHVYHITISSHLGTVSRQICNDSFDDLDRYIFGWVQGQGRIRMCFFIFLFICMYIVPIFVIVYTCVRISIVMLFDVPQLQLNNTNRMKAEKNKRNVACMVVVVAIFFLVCWTPFYLVTLISQIQEVSFLKKSNYLFIMLLTHFSGFVNSSLNPFIYFVFSANFRKALKASLLGRCADRSEGDVKIVMRKCESTKTYV